MIFLYFHGYLPTRVDHCDTNKLNNLAINLRAATPSQNQHNAGLRKNNTSGVKGVCWCKTNKRWVAHIRKHRESFFVGYFEDIEEAKTAIKNFRVVLHGDFANHG